MITLSIERGFQNPYIGRELDNVEKVKGIIYARVSTDDQAQHGYSLESQVERCAEKLKSEHDLNDDDIMALIEMGEMGDDPNRPALGYARWLIEQGVGEKVCCIASRPTRQKFPYSG